MTAEPDARNHPRLRRVFQGQLVHLGLLGALLMAIAWVARQPVVAAGELWGWSSSVWLWITAGSAVAHQVYVWLGWRVELHTGAITRAFPVSGFRVFRVGFAVLGLSRLTVVPLAVANRGTLELPAIVQWGGAGVCALLSGYLFYSVARYFGFARAMGADHFDPEARDWPLVREGIFRYTSNGMYSFGFLVLWIPGLALESAAALLAAAFQHACIWVHFHCTEEPDMERIYGGRTLTE